jgi:hypothetical protein
MHNWRTWGFWGWASAVGLIAALIWHDPIILIIALLCIIIGMLKGQGVPQ